MSRGFKRKLVFELGSDCRSGGEIPAEYSRNKLKWLCDVIVEGHDNKVDEYTITPDKKLYLNELLKIVKAEVEKLIDNQSTDWGIKIYRLTPSKKR